MACFESGTVVSLTHREALALPDVRGATLRVIQGTVWLTEEHAPRATDVPHDIVLRPGDNWVVEHDGNTVVEAQNDAVFCMVGRRGAALRLVQSHPGGGRMRSVSARIVKALAGFFMRPPRYLPYV
jgi:hypothetical protein